MDWKMTEEEVSCSGEAAREEATARVRRDGVSGVE